MLVYQYQRVTSLRESRASYVCRVDAPGRDHRLRQVGKLLKVMDPYIHRGCFNKAILANDTWTLLVGGWPTPLKDMKVSWDDEIPNIWKFTKKKFQSTNQISCDNSPPFRGDFKGTGLSLTHLYGFLVGGWATPLKNISSSVGMMKFAISSQYIYMGINKIHVPNHQPVLVWTWDGILL